MSLEPVLVEMTIGLTARRGGSARARVRLGERVLRTANVVEDRTLQPRDEQVGALLGCLAECSPGQLCALRMPGAGADRAPSFAARPARGPPSAMEAHLVANTVQAVEDDGTVSSGHWAGVVVSCRRGLPMDSGSPS
mgnify:CR=1 FL=1